MAAATNNRLAGTGESSPTRTKEPEESTDNMLPGLLSTPAKRPSLDARLTLEAETAETAAVMLQKLVRGRSSRRNRTTPGHTEAPCLENLKMCISETVAMRHPNPMKHIACMLVDRNFQETLDPMAEYVQRHNLAMRLTNALGQAGFLGGQPEPPDLLKRLHEQLLAGADAPPAAAQREVVAPPSAPPTTHTEVVQADLLQALAALNADVQAAPTEQLSAGKLRALAEQLGQLKADAERMADAMEAKGAAKTAAGAKPASKADASVLAVMTPEAQAAAQARTLRLLDSLAAKAERVERPVLLNSERRRSGQRGMTRALLFGVKAFFEQHNALDKVMQDIVNEHGFPFSACELTKSTGLSLTETLVREAGEGEGIEELVGEATCFFSYSWTGTKLRDLLAAIERVLAKLEAADGKRRYVWVDILCASQNLLQGVIKDPDLSSAEVGIEDAISTAGELLFYMEPLSLIEWAAPAHPFLLPEQGEPAAGWMRRGPAALTRAWCIFELAKSLSKGCTLHVLLSETSVAQFEDKMRNDGRGHRWIGQILGRVDVKQAQITKVEDHAYILGEVKQLPGGLGAINSRVMAALGGWVVGEAQAMLAALPEAKRGTSPLLSNVAGVLGVQGRLAEAEVLERERLAAKRAEGGDRHPSTLGALNNLADNLRAQGKLAEAEPLLREALAARREVSGNDDKQTMNAAGNLGKVLLAQGKLAEAEPLLVEAVAWCRKTSGFGRIYQAVLVELRREQGRLAEAEQELGTLVADARKGWGPQDLDTLEAEAVAARLRHAQPDGAAAGAAELRAVVERMGEFLGAAHQYTVRWQRVLERMSAV